SAEDLGVDERDVAQEATVEEPRQVAVFAAVFRARRLMLVVVVLEGLREAHRRKPGLDEGPVVSAAPQAIEAKDEADGARTRDLLHGAGEVPRRRVDAVGPAAREDPDAVRSSGGRIGADDVVVEEAADRVAAPLDLGEQP